MPNPCQQNPFSSLCTAKTRNPTSFESRGAELYTYFNFMYDFKTRYPGSLVVNNVFKGERTSDIVIDIILKWLESDFKNAYSQRDLKNAAATGRRPDQIRPGGLRKPDVLGIAILPDKTLLELVEVTTVSQAASTMQEDVTDKLSILENQVKPHAARDISTVPMSTGAANIEVLASPWRFPWPLMEIPLISAEMVSSPSGAAFEWWCFKPTCRENPPSGRDGLVLYEIHSTGDRVQVPQRVLRAAAQRARQLGTANELTLLPGLKGYWRENAADQQQILSYVALGLGAALLVALVIFLLPEEALVGLAVLTARAAVIGVEALEGLGTAVRLLPQAINTGLRILSSAGVSLGPAMVF